MSRNNKYWFKRRRYGWGWTPVTWQGWLTVFGILAGAVLAAKHLPPKPQTPTGEEMFLFIASLALIVVFAIAIGSAKGPSPRWRWGKKSSDNSEEDI